MRRLKIHNFAAVSDAELDIDKNLNILIGAQASGKSTIAKVLYFCRKIRDFYVEYLIQAENFERGHKNEDYINFLKYVRSCFISCFGTTLHMESFEIEYWYCGEKEKVVIVLEDKYAKIRFSPSLKEQIEQNLRDVRTIHESPDARMKSFLEKLRFQEELREHYDEIAKDMFHDSEEIIYIPAGRSLLSVMSDQMNVIDNRSLDLPMRNFIELIAETRKKSGTRMDRMVSDYVKTVQGQIKNADVNMAYDMVRKILKADYISDSDGERLYYTKNKWVKIAYSSSGQQESLWILLPLFVRILENKRCFVVIEEPEAHLFPDAQKTIVEMVSLFIYSTGSSVLLTTHSPYILTAWNLLVHSYIVETRKKTAGREVVVPRALRMPVEELEAYLIQTGQKPYLKRITTEDSGLIDAMEIDRISDVINQGTERLLDMEYEDDM